MRRRLKSTLGKVTYADFLVYLMGPYTSFDVADLLPSGESADDVSLPDAAVDDRAIDEMLATLHRVQGHLRTDPGVNVFLAVDAEIPLEEMDAATQSIRFARASNAVALVVPHLGDNFGVGMEVGAVLEDLYPDCERVVFAHEEAVSSAMIGGVAQRWEARVVSYGDEAELVAELRQFVAEIMHRELTGDLSQKGGEE